MQQVLQASTEEQTATPSHTSADLMTLVTFKEAMHYLRVSRSTLYRLMWSGQLTGHKIGSTWRFYMDDLQNCVKETTPPLNIIPM